MKKTKKQTNKQTKKKKKKKKNSSFVSHFLYGKKITNEPKFVLTNYSIV